MKELLRYDANYKALRLRVFQRDKYKCQICGSKSNLTIHHIENFATNQDARYEDDNCITLCSKCHTNFHKIYSNKNNNRKQLDKFIAGYNRRKRKAAQRIREFDKEVHSNVC